MSEESEEYVQKPIKPNTITWKHMIVDGVLDMDRVQGLFDVNWFGGLPEKLEGVRIDGIIENANLKQSFSKEGKMVDARLKGMLDISGNPRPFNLDEIRAEESDLQHQRLKELGHKERSPNFTKRRVKGGNFEGVTIIGSQEGIIFEECQLVGSLDKDGKPFVIKQAISSRKYHSGQVRQQNKEKTRRNKTRRTNKFISNI